MELLGWRDEVAEAKVRDQSRAPVVGNSAQCGDDGVQVRVVVGGLLEAEGLQLNGSFTGEPVYLEQEGQQSDARHVVLCLHQRSVRLLDVNDMHLSRTGS